MGIWRKWRNPRQKPPFGARIDWGDPVAEGLVYCQLFNAFDLDGFGDASLFSHKCELHGPRWVGPAISFDGSNDWAETPHHDVLSLGGELPFTIEVLLVILKDGAQNRILAKEDRANSRVRYYVTARADGADYFELATLASDGWHGAFSSDYRILFGNVQHIVVTYDTESVTWFIDGKKDTVTAFSPSYFPTDPARPLWLGYDPYYGNYLGGKIFHIRLWNGRCLSDSEIERLHDEPYSFFLIPAARIFDLAPSGFTTTQDITWRLFTSKENQIIYNILTDKQASFGYKIFDRKDNSITYRIFTQDGSSFTWKIFNASNQDISYKIFTRLQSDLSWAIASTALSQAITYKIFTRNEINISWLILTAEAYSLDWSIFTTKEQQAIWNILAQTETDLIWDIYTRKDTALAYKIFKDLDQDLIYKIFNSTEQDLVWKILAAGLLSEILSWKVYARQEDGLSWKVFAAEKQELFYKIFNVKEDEITWLIKREDAADLSWKLFNLKEDPILWKIYSQAEKTLAWSILAALTSQDISYKIFTVKDEELFYIILAEASKSLDWKIYTFNEQDLSWQVLTDTIPEPLALFKAKRRTLVFSPTRRIIVFKA